jgi:hypothetical protein
MRALAALLMFALPAGARADTTTYAAWIDEMKTAERGPFSQIRWFCRDGAVVPPKAFACAERGGGHQHGEWSERTQALRGKGYLVANVLAGIDAEAAVAKEGFPDELGQILVEKYLVAVDDGWIFRRAQFYRGAIQEEDERAGGRDLLRAMAAVPDWTGYRYVAHRAAARLLPHGRETASVQKVRQEAAALSDLDPGFAPLRAKIHGTPEAKDAARVREYAAKARNDLRPRYEALAAEIDGAYAPVPLADTLEAAAGTMRALAARDLLRAEAQRLRKAASDTERYASTAAILAGLREAVGRVRGASDRLRLVDASLAVEDETFRLGTLLRPGLPGLSRAAQVPLLRAGAEAAYGAGLVNGRQRRALAAVFDTLGAPELRLADYHARLHEAALLPGWAGQSLRMHFFEPTQKLAEIEPRADVFLQDQLRGGALFFYSEVLDELMKDADRLAGVERRLFGKSVGTGLSALNPGLARGILRTSADARRPESFRRDGIYLLPETVAELPPVAGILTRGAGNPLSHVQLLARNLGIPNVSVGTSLVDALREHDGKKVVLAVSRNGVVQLEEDGPQWEKAFGRDAAPTAGVLIRPDLQKLDLSVRSFLSLDKLRAVDSGRIVGPKAAKLGELRHAFPEATAPGVAIPFGLYREAVLDKPHPRSGKTVFEWMTAEFRRIEAMPQGSNEEHEASEALRAEIYDIVRTTDPGPEFRRRLKEAMDREFGADFRGGVFVRSDTNVEDLPGFTGAGINLTLPNVVGFENVMKALGEVWASPFSPRSFAWRRGNMTGPEHVYPAILLLVTVPSEKSGVMVTQDLDTGDRKFLSVAVNEGVEGAVEGQAAETLRVDTRDGSVRLLAAATAPWRRVPVPTGGVVQQRTTGTEEILLPGEVQQLVAFWKALPTRFPPILDGEGQPTAADVEFAFVGGKLFLLQIRPFNESTRARGNAYLRQLDQGQSARLQGSTVRMSEVPAP